MADMRGKVCLVTGRFRGFFFLIVLSSFSISLSISLSLSLRLSHSFSYCFFSFSCTYHWMAYVLLCLQKICWFYLNSFLVLFYFFNFAILTSCFSILHLVVKDLFFTSLIPMLLRQYPFPISIL